MHVLVKNVRNLYCLFPYIHDPLKLQYKGVSFFFKKTICTIGNLGIVIYLEFQVVFTVSSFVGNPVLFIYLILH